MVETPALVGNALPPSIRVPRPSHDHFGAVLAIAAITQFRQFRQFRLTGGFALIARLDSNALAWATVESFAEASP